MRVIDIAGEHLSDSWAEVKKCLQTRDEKGMNEFILTHQDLGERVKTPMLVISVNAEYACVHFHPDLEDHPGYQSVGKDVDLDPEGETLFSCGGERPMGFPNSTVISTSLAIRAAKQFYEKEQRPEIIEWREL